MHFNNNVREELTMSDNYNGSIHIARGIKYSLDDIATKRNNNVLAVGASGTSKTRSYVIPNIIEASGSYVISDPKGTLYLEYGEYLKNKGYRVCLLDFRNINHSSRYNPLDYVKTDEDILKLATAMLGAVSSRDNDIYKYWELSGAYLLAAVISYVKNELEEKYHNIGYIYRAISTRYIRVMYSNLLEEFLHDIDRFYNEDEDVKVLMEDMKYGMRFCGDELIRYAKNKGYVDVKMDGYFKFLNLYHPTSASRFFSQLIDGADKTMSCIYMQANSALQMYSSDKMIKLTKKSDFNFRDLGQRKMALFVTCSDTDRSMDSFVSLFYSQCLQELCGYADNDCRNGRLPMPVRFFLDDFATNFKIVDFDKIIAMIRSRGISANIIIQDLHQLKTCYKDAAETIINNCDTILYLGGNDYDTYEAMARQMNASVGEIRNMGYLDCFVYRRMESSEKAKCIDLEKFKICMRNNMDYHEKYRHRPAQKQRVGFQVC